MQKFSKASINFLVLTFAEIDIVQFLYLTRLTFVTFGRVAHFFYLNVPFVAPFVVVCDILASRLNFLRQKKCFSVIFFRLRLICGDFTFVFYCDLFAIKKIHTVYKNFLNVFVVFFI